MKRVSIKRRHLMEAARRATIARELIAVAPDAPWFLWNMLGGVVDTPSGRPLALGLSASDPTKGTPK